MLTSYVVVVIAITKAETCQKNGYIVMIILFNKSAFLRFMNYVFVEMLIDLLKAGFVFNPQPK